MADDDDEDSLQGLYENGHWIWDDKIKGLNFVSDLPEKRSDAVTLTYKIPVGTVEFKDDVDLLEQVRFRKRYQRKVLLNEPDVITLQDIKDVALFTAPPNFLSPMLINFLHLPSTERFIRALILYSQYYLQVAEKMALRIRELQTKIRTPNCEGLETLYHDNLCDLRTLVAKEYATMMIGGSEFKKFHHMGSDKKTKSLSGKDARLFETLIRMCVQIVWLALERRSFNQIELEVNRIFKSEVYNSVEHNLQTNYISEWSNEERAVLLGSCVRRDKKLTTCSPLMNEVFCGRADDYRLMGLGVIALPEGSYSSRLKYMQTAIAAPEEQLEDEGVVCGILGLQRSLFNTMLQVIQYGTGGGTSKSTLHTASTTSRHGANKSKSKDSTTSSTSRNSSKAAPDNNYCYEEVILPAPEIAEVSLPACMPETELLSRPCNDQQRRRWLNRLHRQLHPHIFKKPPPKKHFNFNVHGTAT